MPRSEKDPSHVGELARFLREISSTLLILILIPYAARSSTPVSGGGLESADYFNAKPLTAEPDPLIDFGDSPTTAQSASSIARPLALGPSVSSSITPRTPATPASSVTPKTPKTPWLNHTNASYTFYTSFESNKRGSVAMTGSVALARMTESEKKGYELQTRVYKARGVLPFRVLLRVFRDPEECVWDVVG
ncbi:hypothetical protein EV368DRAFT_80744 [Lentinula lateritia]|nr:hypothetical protein EV368DRAFT_80744 [Lentinula lateritia]